VEPITETNGKSKTKDPENGENTYNARSNYETWITYRWVMHDRPARRRWRTRASQLAGENAGAVEVNQAIHQLASELQESVVAECCNHVACLADDLLNSALERVIWREVARIILSDKIPAAASFDWLFPFGNIVETAGVSARIPREERLAAVEKYAHGDWGEIDGVDWSENESALRSGERIYSEYRSKSGETFLIITAGDRAVTTILLPEEY
jgi:hypothetical protein